MGDIFPLLLGGLVLFLYSITRLSVVLKGIFNEDAKRVIAKYTHSIFMSLLVGTIFTILLGSSSAVIILVIIFINAGTLDFRQSIGLIMGANIGTTFSSQLISLDVAQYATIPLLIGLFMQIFSKGKKYKSLGSIFLFFGMLFFGLFLMEQSVAPLRESDYFFKQIAGIENNQYRGAFIGGLTTLIIQSSSGTVGMAIILGKQELLSLAGGIAVMLGAELGTCSDTLIATIKGKRQAIKAGLFHLIFNLTTIMVGLLLFQPFVDLVKMVSQRTDIGSQIANAHLLFNLLGVLVFLPFVSLLIKGFNFLLPDKKEG